MSSKNYIKTNLLWILNFWHEIVNRIIKFVTMDTIIKSKNNKKKYLTITLPILLIIGYFIYSSLTKERTLNVKKNEISIKAVENNFFEDFIVFQAKVEPKNTMLINIIEGGAVQEIYVENGDLVKAGDVICELENSKVSMELESYYSGLIMETCDVNVKLNLGEQLCKIIGI